MAREARHKTLELDGVAADSLVASALPGRFRSELSAVAPWLALSSRYAEGRSHTLRRLVVRTERRLAQEAGSCVVARIDDVEVGLRILRRLHALRWGNHSAFLSHFDRFTTVCRAAAACGELAIDVLRAGEATVAVLVSFEVAGRVSAYQSGRIPAHPWRNASTVLYARVFADAAARGLREADLLRGDEPYKSLFADSRRELWRLRLAIGPRASVAIQLDSLSKGARHVAGSIRRWLRTIAARRSRVRSELLRRAVRSNASAAPRRAWPSPCSRRDSANFPVVGGGVGVSADGR